MVGKTANPTKSQQRRFDLLPQVGCICCKTYGIHNEHVQIHHIVEGSKRLGHDYTLPLCYYHHEGRPPEGLTPEQAQDMVGPSLKAKKQFNEVFGSELELLEWTNQFLKQIDESIV